MSPAVTTDSSSDVAQLYPQHTLFDEHNENSHQVEFEAPSSAGLSKPPTKGRYTIDLSLELERQLMESPPNTSGHDTSVHSHPIPDNHGAVPLTGRRKPVEGSADHGEPLPDPEIMAHIVTQLRQSLTEMTKERDELVKMLAQANSQEATVKDALQLMSEKATQAEEGLGEARKKMKEDEEQIGLLRAKVEESRRGLMRLQTESRRQSMTIDVNRASALTLTSPPTSKRASFAPLTGSKHRRIPSISDNGIGSFPIPDPSPSPNFQSLEGGLSPNTQPSGLSRLNNSEMESLKVELKSLKKELESARHDLSEANEAKEASETCIKALREFIAENNVGATNVKLPPPPSMTNGDEEPKKAGTGWGFKLWGSGSSATSTNVESPLRTGMLSSAGVVYPGTQGVPSNQIGASSVPFGNFAAVPTIPTSSAPLSRKLTGLFSSRSSISSTNSKEKEQRLVQIPGIAAPGRIEKRDSGYSHSDASSVVEPISPPSVAEVLGLEATAYGCGPVQLHAGLGEKKVVTDLENRPDGMHLSTGGTENGIGEPTSFHEIDIDGELR